MKIIKRNGTEVDYDGSKIINAARKANQGVDDSEKMSELQLMVVEENVRKKLEKKHHTPTIEEIQDMVIHEIMRQQAFRVAQLYTEYRYKQMLVRKKNSTDDAIMTLIEYQNEEVKQENSNKNPMIVSTQRDYMAGEVSKDLTWRLLLPSDIVKAHEEGIIHFHDADYFLQHISNCFSGKTEFVTSEGIRKFNDFKDGEQVTILDKDGIWRNAVVHQYGNQVMYDITFQAGRTIKTITATKNHRWILKDGTITTRLSVDDSLIPLQDMMLPIPKSKSDIDMWCFGFAIGDGSDEKHGIRVRLCGDKMQHFEMFSKAGYNLSKEYANGDKDLYKVTKMSKQKFLTTGAWRYMSLKQKQMLLLGYYAADGAKDRNAMHTADDRIAEMICDISAVCGWHISSHDFEVHDTNYKKNAQLHTIRFRKHQNNNNCWIVKEIRQHDKSDRPRLAWCVEEPVTHSFTLAGGIVTGNCCLINLEDMLENGTVITDTKIDPPNSISTACNVATQIIAQVASNQYGLTIPAVL